MSNFPSRLKIIFLLFVSLLILLGIRPLSWLAQERSLPSETSEKAEVMGEAVGLLTSDEIVADLVEWVGPSVVSIVDLSVLNNGPEALLENHNAVMVGTGFVVAPGDMVVTASHVVEKYQNSVGIVKTNGEKLIPLKVLIDSSADIAFLKFENKVAEPLVLGDSSTLRVGQFVIAIGNAQGRYTNTVTTGVVSGIGREVRADAADHSLESFSDVIQTDAALNPGTSGGPLLNRQGEVVGMAVAVLDEGENIGFALPVNRLRGALAKDRIN